MYCHILDFQDMYGIFLICIVLVQFQVCHILDFQVLLMKVTLFWAMWNCYECYPYR